MKNLPWRSDDHMHSRLSDGDLYIAEHEKLIDVVKGNTQLVAFLLDHDIAEHSLSGIGYYTGSGVEVSTYFHDKKFSEEKFFTHLGFYAKEFSSEVDEILKGTRIGKIRNLKKNIKVLNQNGFEIESGEFFKFFKQTTGNGSNLNNFQLAQYIVSELPEARSLFHEINGSKPGSDFDDSVNFAKKFLRYNGKFARQGFSEEQEIIGLDPEILASLAEKNEGLICFVHPHVTCMRKGETDEQGIERFKKLFHYYYHNYGVRAIELPTTANLKWTKAIINMVEEYEKEPEGCTLLFGSDAHRYQSDETHGTPLSMNTIEIIGDLQQKYRPGFVEKYCREPNKNSVEPIPDDQQQEEAA